ncbi:hypothetical protein NDU88_012047 [Pleurodeles waltl]|uniref:Uncharacterized protein n=1 Tax=Pleurodeles waltl TaxID=8319 RepID=A0AAV7R0D8_PLEWA|nr:hypothetical protein NDU88_012047 [Pleurodeles waltl]
MGIWPLTNTYTEPQSNSMSHPLIPNSQPCLTGTALILSAPQSYYHDRVTQCHSEEAQPRMLSGSNASDVETSVQPGPSQLWFRAGPTQTLFPPRLLKCVPFSLVLIIDVPVLWPLALYKKYTIVSDNYITHNLNREARNWMGIKMGSRKQVNLPVSALGAEGASHSLQKGARLKKDQGQNVQRRRISPQRHLPLKGN